MSGNNTVIEGGLSDAVCHGLVPPACRWPPARSPCLSHFPAIIYICSSATIRFPEWELRSCGAGAMLCARVKTSPSRVAPAAAAKVPQPGRVTALRPRARKADDLAINAFACTNDMTINMTSQSIVVLETRLSSPVILYTWQARRAVTAPLHTQFSITSVAEEHRFTVLLFSYSRRQFPTHIEETGDSGLVFIYTRASPTPRVGHGQWMDPR